MKRSITLTLSLLPLAAPALAQEFPEGVYLSSPEQCEEARKTGIENALEQGGLMLSRRGLEGYEYNCEFVDVKKAPRSPGWLVTALCEEPGYAHPDVIAVMPRGEGELELASLSSGGEDGANDGLYGLCEGVSPP